MKLFAYCVNINIAYKNANSNKVIVRMIFFFFYELTKNFVLRFLPESSKIQISHLSNNGISV